MLLKGHRNHKQGPQINLDENNPVIEQFKVYSKELDNKNDKNEHLIKASRDVTIESKRIIFLLHNLDPRKKNKSDLLKEANERIEKLFSHNFASIAKELKDQDVHQFIRAISPGVQEFIEAILYLEWSERNISEECKYYNSNYLCLSSISERIQIRFNYTSGDERHDCSILLIPSEFILGLADLSGEIMRNCINSLGYGDTENCFKTCSYLQAIYSKFLTLNTARGSRDFNQKLCTMRASAIKCEQVLYNVKVRGTEGSKLLSFDTAQSHDVDEGFF